MKLLIAPGTSLAAVAVAGGRTAQPPATDSVWVAQLHSINEKAWKTRAYGKVRFTEHADSLTIHVHMEGMPPDIEHWQHFHGFPDGRQSVCPTIAADTSHDGLIDILETSPAAGTMMVPFNADPVGMDIPTHTYPHAGNTGRYAYTKTVSLSALQRAFGGVYTGGHIDLSRRVAMVHGVPESIALPATVSSLGPIPSRITLPLAWRAPAPAAVLPHAAWLHSLQSENADSYAPARGRNSTPPHLRRRRFG